MIATACGGPECIVSDGNGILVPKDDPLALGNAMEQMYKTVGSYDADRIRADCLSRFGKNVIKDQLTEIYTGIKRNNSQPKE